MKLLYTYYISYTNCIKTVNLYFKNIKMKVLHKGFNINYSFGQDLM